MLKLQLGFKNKITQNLKTQKKSHKIVDWISVPLGVAPRTFLRC